MSKFQVVKKNGGKCSPYMEQSTHLIIDKIDDEKYEYALKYGIRIVTGDWLRDSISQKVRLPEDHYHSDPSSHKVDSGNQIEKLQSKPFSSFTPIRSKSILTSTPINQNIFDCPDVSAQFDNVTPRTEKLTISQNVVNSPKSSAHVTLHTEKPKMEPKLTFMTSSGDKSRKFNESTEADSLNKSTFLSSNLDSTSKKLDVPNSEKKRRSVTFADSVMIIDYPRKDSNETSPDAENNSGFPHEFIVKSPEIESSKSSSSHSWSFPRFWRSWRFWPFKSKKPLLSVQPFRTKKSP
jgi:hypothetical protein